MYNVNFSLNKWNFVTYFNKERDYMFYKEVIENSVYDMNLKPYKSVAIVINYINDEHLYNEMYKKIINKEKKIISSFQNEYYEKYDNVFVSSKNRYLIYKDDHYINIICKEYLKRPELIYIIRELYVRLQENEGKLFMHGNGIKLDDKGLLLLGNSGSGKTTFMFKLFENNPNGFKYLSNDRMFIEDTNVMEYFPIPLILANGTARTIKPIYDYLKDKDQLYDSTFTKEMLLNGKDTEKFELFKNYIPNIFPNCDLEERETVDKIILPKINFDIDKLEITNLSDHNELMKVCFTPVDTESLRKPWIMERDYDDNYLVNNSEKILKNKVDSGLVYKVEYNPNLDSCYLQDQIIQKVLVKGR